MSLKRNTLFQCQDDQCPAVFEVVNPCEHDCDCDPACCDQPMKQLEAKTADASTEKHVPVIEPQDDGFLVKVGSVPHPMEDKHWIQWIELHCTSCGMMMRKFLNPGDEPQAFFPCPEPGNCEVFAREHCNVHGLWKA
jgi:superoxide reductase